MGAWNKHVLLTRDFRLLRKQVLLGPVATYLAKGSEGMIKRLHREQVHHRPCLLVWPAGAREVLPDISAASHGREPPMVGASF